MFGLALTTTGCAEGEDPQQGDWPFGPAVSKRVEPEVAFSELEGEWGHGRFFIGETRQEFHYEMKAGLAIAEGDIILGRVDELTPTQRGVEGVAEAAVHTSKFWEDGVVPYVFDEEIPDYARTAFLEAIQHWEEEAFGITFVERTDEEDYLRVLVRGGAWSYLGRVGGEQEISVGSSLMGVSAHEIGHALGLYHEQSRSDRDEHVTVHWDNIWSGRDYNFKTHSEQGDPQGRDVGEYNIDSIMHYGSWYFSVGADDNGDTLPTITTLDGGWIEPNRSHLTAGDVAAANYLYNTRFEYDRWEVVLAAGDRWEAGTSRRIWGGAFAVTLLDDGNLIVEHVPAEVIWESGTAGLGVTHMVMEEGHLRLNAEGGHIWESRDIYSLHDGSLIFNGGQLGIALPDSGLTWSSFWPE